MRLPNVAALLILLVGLGASLLLANVEQRQAERRDEERFDQLVDRVRTEVAQRVIVYRSRLMGVRGVFAASDHVYRHEFFQLVESRELDNEFPGALGVGYIERVANDPQAIASLVQTQRDEGASSFSITLPAGSAALAGAVTDDRMIVKYIEPVAENRKALGLDIGAHAVRRAAAEKAMLTGEACLTGRIELAQDEQKMAGFLYLLPFYKSGMPVETPEQRVEALLGWVYMPMLGPKVFDGIMSIAGNELDVEVFDGSSLRDESLIYDADDHLSKIDHDEYDEQDYVGRAFQDKSEIEIGGRTWSLSLSTTPEFKHASRDAAWAIGLGGSVLSVLVSFMVYMQGTSTRKAWAFADGMTAELRDYAHKAEQATHAKSAFLANMSHEIRTPMTAILGFTDLLGAQIDLDNQELVDHTQTIKRNGEHLLSVINDILDLSKIEAGKLDVERIEVRPNEILGEVLSLMSVKADEKNLPLTARLLTPVPAVIHSDPVRIRQVLVNLVGNAIKFTEQGGVRIEVRFDEPMQELKLAVTDTGIGLADEQVTRLFGAFEQADATITREYGGTGLGLNISHRLAHMLGGDIRCNSELGKGSTFTVTIKTGSIDPARMLPVGGIKAVKESAGDEQRQSTEQATGASNNEQTLPLAGMKILLAEDGKDNQRLINHHLTKAGALVSIVENGRLAIEALTANGGVDGPLTTPSPFDLLLSDMQMPEMDGYTAVRRLRLLGSTLPIVALTAHAMNEDEGKCRAAGCDAYASKPIDKQKLIAVCLQAVEQKVQQV